MEDDILFYDDNETYVRLLCALISVLRKDLASCQLQWKLFVAVVKADDWLDRLDDEIFLSTRADRLLAIKERVVAMPDLNQVLEEIKLADLNLDDLFLLNAVLADRNVLKFHKLHSSIQTQFYNILPNIQEGLFPDAIFSIQCTRLSKRRLVYFGGEIEDLFYIAQKGFKHFRNGHNNRNGKELKLATTMNLAFKHFMECNKSKLFSMSENDAVYLIVCQHDNLLDNIIHYEQYQEESEIFASDRYSVVIPCYLLAFNLAKVNKAMKLNERTWFHAAYDWLFNEEDGKVTRLLRFLRIL